MPAGTLSPDLAAKLAQVVVGQHRAIARVARLIADWREEPSPRFPLRLMFTGPTSVGKQLLASTIADAMFEGRFAKHAADLGDPPLRQNHALRDLGAGPLVLFFKTYEPGVIEEPSIGILLETGGLILGNGRSRHFADSLVVISATEEFSERIRASQSPQAIPNVDAIVELEQLGVADLAQIISRLPPALSERARFPITVSAAAANALAARAVGAHPLAPASVARRLDDALSDLVVPAILRDEAEVERMREAQRTLSIDHHERGFTAQWLTAEAPRPQQLPASAPPAAAVDRQLDVDRRPREFAALGWREETRFDAFISYKIRKYRDSAVHLRNELRRRGCDVWLDEDQIGRAGDPDRSDQLTREQLIRRLTEGVAASLCTIVFEATLAAVALTPGRSREEAFKSGYVMRSEGDVMVAWNWQKLEIDSSSRVIVIRAGLRQVSALDAGRDVTTAVLGSGDVPHGGLGDIVFGAIEYFRGRG